VYITQVSYLLMVYTHPGQIVPALWLLCIAYFLYATNVAQYIHRTQRMKKDLRLEELEEAA
jgi:hypothetical protein